MCNSSSITEFLLLAFADTRELQLLHFALFLGIYLAALLGNGLIITAVACDHHLHTPMYFFLLNLALLDLGGISASVLKAMDNFLSGKRTISYAGCAAQVFLVFFFYSSEISLLTVMAYDRYIAICKPLHYGTFLSSRACARMAAAAWGSGFLHAVLHTASTFSLPLGRGNALHQFFCEIPQILKLSCSDSYLREVRITTAVNVFLVNVLLVQYSESNRAHPESWDGDIWFDSDDGVEEVSDSEPQLVSLRPLVKTETTVDDNDEIRTTVRTIPWSPAELIKIQEKFSRRPGESEVEYV
ncbi:olfactory receptor 14C36-like [Anas acuta]|uniref:olfactory receptor 14C36-like n=1 Tax=Anas acuta TaxID=28680 RepID=UPI0035C8C2BB